MRKYKGLIGRLAAVGVYFYLNRVEILQIVKELGLDKYFDKNKSNDIVQSDKDKDQKAYIDTLLERIKTLENQVEQNTKVNVGQTGKITENDQSDLDCIAQFMKERAEYIHSNPDKFTKEEYENIFGKQS